MADDGLDFGIDLADVRTRLEGMGYFLNVADALEASEALDGRLAGSPPAAFVAISDETGQPGRTIQGHSQLVNVTLSVLFVERAARFDRSAKDRMEKTRKAVTRILIAWKPEGAQTPLEYRRYRIVDIGNGLVWGEVTFTTTYRLAI